MENKLQALTDKLYQDGLSKGKEEGERLLQEAKAQASRIVESAQEQAKEIVEKARKEAEDLKNNTLTEIKITSRQMISTLKEEVENHLMRRSLVPALHSAMEQVEFVQLVIVKAMECFKPAGYNGSSLELLLPEDYRDRFDKFLEGQLGADLEAGLEVKFDGDLKGGFKIVNKSEGYQLSFTEEDFMALFEEYARPRIKQLLF